MAGGEGEAELAGKGQLTFRGSLSFLPGAPVAIL